MKIGLIIIVILFSNFIFGQKEENEDEYLFQAYTIFELTSLNKLFESKDLFDSIQINLVYQSFYNQSRKDWYSYTKIYPLDSVEIQKKIIEIQTNYPKDSIVFQHREKVEYTIKPTLNKIEYPEEYKIKVNRNQKCIKSIETEYLKAKFIYDKFDNVIEIKFQYFKKVKFFYEGTIDYLQFEYSDGKLISCKDNYNFFIYKYYKSSK
ncbi:MAG: hypothetical protein HYR91_09860 [Flavobacteriia bacterium]|nr:hypothetical protein [Flavobacteriia bacterium]